MKTQAAVAWKAGAPLTIETVDLEGPRAGEVLVEIKATGICHTDYYTLSGADPEGLFPAILGHEGAGVVVDVGAGVATLKKGDHVIPLYTPECRSCKFCLSRKTNLCQLIRGTQGKGLMPQLAHDQAKLIAQVAALTKDLEQARKDGADAEIRRDTAKAESQKADADLAAARTQLQVFVVKHGELTRESSRLEGTVEQLETEKEALEKEIGRHEARSEKAP